MKINKTIPKDKSNYMYYDDIGLDLKCTKPLLIILNKGFKVGVYVHTRKQWLDEGTFEINKESILGWVDVDEELISRKKE